MQRLLGRFLSMSLAIHFMISPGYAPAADPVNESSPYTIQLNFGLPNDGYLDNFHDSKLIKGATKEVQMEYSFYALRNLSVLKLLKSRKALKEIIGSESILQEMGHAYRVKNLSFDVPKEVKDLYQGKHEIIEISEDISWLGGEDQQKLQSFDGSFSLEKRINLMTGLVALSIQLIKYDGLIKYVREDIWPKAFPDKVARKFLKKKYKENYHLAQLENQLIGQRDGILLKYHILGTEEKKIPLYKRIYKYLEERHEFPSADIRLTPELPIFVDGQDVKLPTNLEDLISSKMIEVMQDQNKSRLYKEIDPMIEKSLIILLKNNTEALRKLTAPVHYSDDEDIFMYLSLSESLWAETKKYYSHLAEYINFDQGNIHAYSLRYDSELLKSTLKKVAIEVGVALTIISAIFTGGSTLFAGGAAAGGVGASATAATLATAASLTGGASGALLLGQSIYSYAQARQYSEYAQNFFYGSADLASLDEVKGMAKIEESEFRSMIFSLILVGAPTAAIRVLSKTQNVIVIGGRRLVFLRPEMFTKLEEIIKASKDKFVQLGQLGNALLRSNLNTLIKATGQTTRVAELEVMIARAAEYTGMTVAKAKEIIKSTPQVQHLMNWYSGKIAANPLFMVQMVREIGVELVVQMASEIIVRGDAFWDEFPYVIANMLISVGLITALVSKSTASAGNSKMMFDVLLDKRSGFFAKGISSAQKAEALKESFKIFYKTGKDLAVTGFGVSMVMSGGVETVQYLKEPGKEEVLERFKRVLGTSLFYGLFMGVSSNLRSQAINGWLEPSLASKMGKKAMAKAGVLDPSVEQIMNAAKTSREQNTLMTGISFSNNLFGTFTSSWMLHETGLQTPEKVESTFEETLKGIYMRFDTHNNNAEYLFDFI